jgi:hypothetical protein
MREMWRKGLFTRYLQLFRYSRCQTHGTEPPLLPPPELPQPGVPQMLEAPIGAAIA